MSRRSRAMSHHKIIWPDLKAQFTQGWEASAKGEPKQDTATAMWQLGYAEESSPAWSRGEVGYNIRKVLRGEA